MAFKRLFDRHFYGNPDRRDYGAQDQPHTRKELFKTVFSVYAGRMTGYSLLYILPWLPAIAWSCYALFRVLMLANQAGGYDAAQIEGVAYVYALVMMPLTAIIGPFQLAASYVMRNWARDEYADMALDYRNALKQNWKQGLMFSTMNGVLIPVAFFYFNLCARMAQTNVFFYLPFGVLILVLVIWQLCCMVIPTMCVTYRLPYRHIVRNALIISCSCFLRAAGVWLITMIVPIAAVLICCLDDSATVWALPCVIAFKTLFGSGLNRLIIASYANMVCEKYINSKIDGAPTNIGLHDLDCD